jgi:hypothetical protein
LRSSIPAGIAGLFAAFDCEGRVLHRCLSIIAVVWLASIVAGQSADRRNAATWYRQAIERYMSLPPGQVELLANYDPSAGPPSPQLRAALASVQGILSDLQRGSRQDYADYDLDRGRGIELELPHLHQLRAIAKIARTDALVRLNDGDASGAAERIASLYRASAHNGDDRTIISSLVGQAMFSMADQVAQRGLDAASFNAADGAMLLGAVKSLPAQDPFNYVEGVVGEQEMVGDWAAANFGGEDGPARFAEMLGQWNDNPQLDQLAGLDEDAFGQALEQHGDLLNEVVEIYSMPDGEKAKAEIARLEGEVARGEHGLLSMILAPAFGKVLERKLEGESLIAERRALYEKLASGEALPAESANAAVWYLRAVNMISELEPASMQAVRDFAVELPDEAPEALAAALAAKGREIIDVLREGSLIRRCDFSFARRPDDLLAPGYAPGMNDALKLLRADALRSILVKDLPGAVDRLATSFRVIAHLGADPHIACALVAHHNFNEAADIMEAAFDDGALTVDAKPALLDAVERISRKDPFGYVNAIVATRKSLADRLNRQATIDEAAHMRRAAAVELINAFNGDQLLYALAVFDTLTRAAAAPAGAPAAAAAPAPASRPASAGGDSLQRLDDVFSLEDLEAARDRVHQLAPLIAQHEWGFLSDMDAPSIALDGVPDGLRRARGDLRVVLILLKPPAPPTRKDAEKAAE